VSQPIPWAYQLCLDKGAPGFPWLAMDAHPGVAEDVFMKPFPLGGAIFDLDGVLVDTACDHFEAWQQTARSLGFDLPAAEGERLKGVGRHEALDIVLSIGRVSASESRRAQLADEKNTRYLKRIAGLGPERLLPGARAALAELRRRHIPVALASSSKNARAILRQTQIDSCFDAIIDGNAITRTKPDPEIFLLAAAGLRLPAGACVVFEDAEAGVTAARRAGCRVVGIGGRPFTAAELTAAMLSEVDLSLLFGPG
jgi:beta-phosphoglucomutase